MYVFIYTYVYLHSYGLDEIEDLLRDEFKEIGELTGSGSGNTGCNFDLEIYDDKILVDDILKRIKNVWKKLNLKEKLKVDINGKQMNIEFE